MRQVSISFLLLAAPLLGATPHAQEGAQDPQVKRVVEGLRSTLGDDGLSGRDLDGLADAPVLTGMSLLFREGEASGAPTPGQREQLVELLVLLDEKTEGFLIREISSSSTLREREVAIELYGRIGNYKTITHLSKLVTASNSDDVVEAAVYGGAIAGIIERDREVLRISGQIFNLTDARLQPALVKAIGQFESHEALESLASLLGRRRALDGQVLSAMRKVASSLHAPFDDRILDIVRPLLDDRDESVRKEAILVSGALEDRQAVPRLIDIMESPDSSGDRSLALKALGGITRQTFRSHADTWRSWYRLQEDWWTNDAGEIFSNLSGELPVAVAAVNEILSHPLYRHELAEELATHLRSGREQLRPLVCIALGQLQSAAAVPHLSRLLEEDPSLTYVHKALEQLGQSAG